MVKAILIIAALTLPAWPAQVHAQPAAPGNPPPSGAATCPADADLSGLIDAVETTISRLVGLDREAVSDLLSITRSYRAEREHLCVALDAANEKADAAIKMRDMAQSLADIWEADAAKCHEALKTLPARRRWPLGWTAGVGACLADDNEIKVTGGVLWGFQF